jgi:hypothetical protein
MNKNKLIDKLIYIKKLVIPFLIILNIGLLGAIVGFYFYWLCL